MGYMGVERGVERDLGLGVRSEVRSGSRCWRRGGGR
jgi:hypothetical protein